MKKIILYSYSKCSTCKKASKWLDQRHLEFQLIDIVKEPPKIKYLDLALKQYSADKREIFNTRGKSFKSINFDIYSLPDEEIIKLLLCDGKLIKRPFLVLKEKKITFGFNEAGYSNQFIQDGYLSPKIL